MSIISQPLLLSGAAALPGVLSLLWNTINSRREQLKMERPKLNVTLTNDRIENRIEAHLEIQNVGTHELEMQSFRLYVYDLGFSSDFRVGMANYNDNLFVYKNRILNRVNHIDEPFTYEGFVKVVCQLLGYDRGKVTKTVTAEIFTRLKEYSNGLAEFDDNYGELTPIVFIRPFFLFPENIDYYSKLKMMPPQEFPQAVDVILFDRQAYDSRVKRDVYALSEFVYRLNWEKNPAWSVGNDPILAEYAAKHQIHEIHIFSKRAQPVLSVAPTEIGIPSKLSPQEKRSINFQIQVAGKSEYSVRVHLWLSSNQVKYMVLKRPISSDYHFTATPRGWMTPIVI